MIYLCYPVGFVLHVLYNRREGILWCNILKCITSPDSCFTGLSDATQAL